MSLFFAEFRFLLGCYCDLLFSLVSDVVVKVLVFLSRYICIVFMTESS